MIRTGQVAVSLKGSSWLLGFETSWMPSNVCLWNTIAIKLQVCSSRSKKKMELSSSIQIIFRELQTRNGRVRLSKGTSLLRSVDVILISVITSGKICFPVKVANPKWYYMWVFFLFCDIHVSHANAYKKPLYLLHSMNYHQTFFSL